MKAMQHNLQCQIGETLIFTRYPCTRMDAEDRKTMKESFPLRRENAHRLATLELLIQAHNLVNPSSGLANDFLNQYNEILLLVENLPVLLPEMVEELLAWKPKTYKEYFTQSNLPGADIAIKLYGHLDKRFVKLFEAEVSAINHLAGKSD